MHRHAISFIFVFLLPLRILPNTHGLSCSFVSPPSTPFSFRMLKVGLPIGAVKNALQRDGQDPSIMDLDQNRYVISLLFRAQVLFICGSAIHGAARTIFHFFVSPILNHILFCCRRPIQIQLDERNKYREFDMSDWM